MMLIDIVVIKSGVADGFKLLKDNKCSTQVQVSHFLAPTLEEPYKSACNSSLSVTEFLNSD